MQRLWPAPTVEVTPAEQYRDVARQRHLGRPWVGLCMVASVDGSTVVEGRSGALGSETDRQVLLALREAADVVLVGAATVRAEGYGVPRKAGQRVGVVTSSGSVEPDLDLFRSGAGFLVTTEDAPDHGLEAVRAGRGRVDLGSALARLDATFVQAEGGALLNASLLEADLIDEVNLTVSPVMVGGHGPRLTNGAAPVSRALALAHLCHDDQFVFLRYVRARVST